MSMLRYITVGARVRPETEVEKAQRKSDAAPCVQQATDGGGAALVMGDRRFPLHFVLGAGASQQEVAGDLAANIVHHVLDGDDCCVLVHGGEASGKLHTLVGSSANFAVDDEKRGVMPSVVAQLLDVVSERNSAQMVRELSAESDAAATARDLKGGLAEAVAAAAAGEDVDEVAAASSAAAAAASEGDADKQHAHAMVSYRVFFRAFEITNGGVLNDLLVDPTHRPPRGLTLKQLHDGHGFFCSDLMWQRLEDVQEFTKLYAFAMDNATKKAASDGAMQHPRATVLFQVIYEKVVPDGGRDKALVESCATFVLLAPTTTAAAAPSTASTHGVSHSGRQDALKHLVHCVQGTATGQSNVHFGASTLTKVLQHDIERSFVTVIGCVSPSASQAAVTADTLSFLAALQASPIASQPRKREGTSLVPEKRATVEAGSSSTAELQTLQREIAAMEQSLAAMKTKLAAALQAAAAEAKK